LATRGQIDAVAGVLSDPGNAERTAGEVAELVLAALEKARRQEWKYAVVAQDRRSRPSTAPLASGVPNPREFVPTWLLGPFFTAAEAARAARTVREQGFKAMGAQVFSPGDEIDPDSLKEVLL
jgi:hypothetical protein